MNNRLQIKKDVKIAVFGYILNWLQVENNYKLNKTEKETVFNAIAAQMSRKP